MSTSAGHCVTQRSRVLHNSRFVGGVGSTLQQGFPLPRIARRFPGADASTILPSPDWSIAPALYEARARSRVPLTRRLGRGRLPAGRLLCKVGWRTAKKCGRVLDVDATVQIEDQWYGGQILIERMCGRPGDSGGPVYVDRGRDRGALVGMAIGARTNNGAPCRAERELTIATPLATVERALRVTALLLEGRKGVGKR